MPLPWRPLPKTISRRWASGAVAEALGETEWAKVLFAGEGDVLDAPEHKAFRVVLRSRPERGGPGVKVVGQLLSATEVHGREPPALPEFDDQHSVVKFARAADHAGAIYVDGRAREQPRGSIDHYLVAFGMLAMLTVAPARKDQAPPTQRPDSGRTGRRAPLEVRGTLRVLLELVKRCRHEGRKAVTPAVCVALMLWLEGHRRPRPRDPKRRWPFKTPPSRLALRRKGKYATNDILPLVDETEPWIVTGESIRRLAKAIQDLIASKDGEYDYMKQSGVLPSE